MENLLYDSNPLLISKTLASAIGLNESIVLQQIHYIINSRAEHPENNQQYYHDGKYWVYNTYAEWQEQFPFWNVNSIQKIILRLEKNGFLISGNYNHMGADRTKWYTVNYEAVDKAVEGCFPSCSKSTMEHAQRAYPSCSKSTAIMLEEHNGTCSKSTTNTKDIYKDNNKDVNKDNNKDTNSNTVTTSKTISIPEENINNTDNNYTVDNKEKKEKKDIKNNNNIGYMKEKKEEKERDSDSGNYEGMSTEYITEMVREACQYRKRTADETNDALKVFDYYLKSYKKYRHENHPYMSRQDIDDIVNYMPWFYVVCPDGRTKYIDLNYLDYVKMIDNQFESTSGSDCSMDGFMVTENRRKRYCASVRKV